MMELVLGERPVPGELVITRERLLAITEQALLEYPVDDEHFMSRAREVMAKVERVALGAWWRSAGSGYGCLVGSVNGPSYSTPHVGTRLYRLGMRFNLLLGNEVGKPDRICTVRVIG